MSLRSTGMYVVLFFYVLCVIKIYYFFLNSVMELFLQLVLTMATLAFGPLTEDWLVL